MRIAFPKFDFIGVPFLMGVAAVLLISEAARPLRKRTRPKNERLVLNSAVAATALPVLRFALLPARYAFSRWANKKQFGLLHWLPLPNWAKHFFSFLLLDYSNYMWHVLLHRSDLLWRFHNVHHIDLDMDVSTAWRFHIGENVASVPFRGGAVALVGATPSAVIVYEVFFEVCTAFHHSNVRLPFKLEKVLSKFMVTPRMHGIHHSIVQR